MPKCLDRVVTHSSEIPTGYQVKSKFPVIQEKASVGKHQKGYFDGKYEYIRADNGNIW